MDSAIALVAESLATFLRFYFVILILRILLSWFPNINWLSPPFSWISQITDPYLNLFRSIIPPLGGIDFSPILAIFALQFVSSLFLQVAAAAY
jgi:YggT family protein